MAKKNILQWTFDDEEPPDLHPGARRHADPWRGLLLAVGVVLALGSAGIGGYVFGRYRRVQDLARADLQNVIDLEAWAWQAGNRGLFRSLLDPAAQGTWRSDLERQFDGAARVVRQVTIERLSLLGDLAQVEVNVAEGGRLHHEIRYYRLIDDQWRRTTPGIEGSPGTG
jgi:hypothetical protein